MPDGQAICWGVGTTALDGRREFVPQHPERAQEKPPPLGEVPRGVGSKEAGVPGSQDANRKVWAIPPFAWGMEAGTGMAPSRKQRAGMDALVPRFSSSTTIGNEPWPPHIAQPLANRGAAEQAVGRRAPGGGA